MAQYRCSVHKAISRGKGQSGIAKAAYNAREAIRDDRTGEMKDFSRRHDEVLFSGIFVDPKANAPAWVQNRAELWNAASAAEKRKDAREAQEMIVNLPHELTDQQRRYMLTDFVREQITRGTGRIADVHIHAAPSHGDERNIHAHVLMTLRAIGPEGFGERLPEVTPEQITHWREKWAERGAKELRKAGFDLEADRWAVGHLSLEQQRQAALERGDLAFAETLDREPTKHLGPQVAAMMRKGIESDRGNIYRDTVERNETLAGLKAELAEIERRIEAERIRDHAAGRAPGQQFGGAAQEATERATAPEGLNRTAADIWTAYTRSDNARSFAAAIDESGLMLARVTKQEAEFSRHWSAEAKLEGRFSPVYREGEFLIVNEAGHAYPLNQRTTGETRADAQKFLSSLDARNVPTLSDALVTMEQRAEQHEIERQAFRDLSSVGASKRERDEPKPERDEARAPVMGDDVSPGLVARQGMNRLAKALEAVLSIAEDIFLSIDIAASRPTPELIQARRHARQEAAEQREQIDRERYFSDAEYHRQINEQARLQQQRDEQEREERRNRSRDR